MYFVFFTPHVHYILSWVGIDTSKWSCKDQDDVKYGSIKHNNRTFVNGWQEVCETNCLPFNSSALALNNHQEQLLHLTLPVHFQY